MYLACHRVVHDEYWKLKVELWSFVLISSTGPAKNNNNEKKKSKFNIRHEQINGTPEALENKQTNAWN